MLSIQGFLCVILLYFVFRDKLCGMLQCTNIDVDLPIIGTGRSSYHQYYGQTLCKLV